ncbi:hypothetical protein ACQP1P_16365 [Dactylosporangium sp. CA-052675]|uniref:hypothetical protein n=1 Tax=Dactylosporangium sp. CA-052675 TaxID=3239927 RepID=UPI003D8F4CCF
MRMVFTAAPDDVFDAAQERLVGRVVRWSRGQHREVEPFVVAALVEHRWADGDGLLCRWQPEDLREALCEWFPRRVSMPAAETPALLTSVHTFIDFLFAEDLADDRCAEPAALHALIDAVAGDVAAAMGDETRYGPAKFWTMRMLAAGVDLEQPQQAQRYLLDVQAGRVAVEQHHLDRVMADDAAAGGNDRMGPLPPVDLPTDAETAALAAASVMLERIRRFADWVGAGRALTATGRLRLADAAELIALLGLADRMDPVIGGKVFRTGSTDELYETSVLFAWAKAARTVRVVKGRLLPVKAAARLLTDPAALAHRAFEAFFGLREAVCPAGYAASPIGWRFEEAAFAISLALYVAREPISTQELGDLAFAVAGEAAFIDTDAPDAVPLRRACDADLDCLLEQLALLGVVELGQRHATLLPLGTALVAAHLRGQGATTPSFDTMRAETAEVVVTHAAAAPPAVGDALLDRWYRANPETARRDLLALAARTDDPHHRRLAREYAHADGVAPVRRVHRAGDVRRRPKTRRTR